jgi:phosphatidylglycerol:prolipoprotein diacylglycerol transferase
VYPFLIDPNLGIPTYLLVISLTYCLCILWVVSRAKRSKMSPTITLDFCLAIMIGGFIGARGAHILLEQWDYYWNDPIRILYVWQGGFVFYGGFVGALLGSIFVFFKNKIKQRGQWLDLFAPVLEFGYAIGRLGCFFGGCCFGRSCDLPWAITFPEGVDAPAGIPIHPTQLYAVILGLMVTAIILVVQKFKVLKVAGQSFSLWLILHGISRLLVEQFRDDWRGEMIVGLSVSSWMSLLLIIVGISLLKRRLVK